MSRGFSAVGDRYRVRLQITEHETPTGQFRHDHRVLEVLEFFPASKVAKQLDFTDELKLDRGKQPKLPPSASSLPPSDQEDTED